MFNLESHFFTAKIPNNVICTWLVGSTVITETDIAFRFVRVFQIFFVRVLN